MSVVKKIVAGALVPFFVTATAHAGVPVSAQQTRSAAAVPQAQALTSTPLRASKHVEDGSNLLGAPLFLVFLGAVAVTIGTIIIVNNNGNGSSLG